MSLLIFQVISVLGAVIAGLFIPLIRLKFFIPPLTGQLIEIILPLIALSNLVHHFRSSDLNWKEISNWFSLNPLLEVLCFLPIYGLFFPIENSHEANLLLVDLVFLRHLVKIPRILDHFSDIKPLTYRIIPLGLLLPILLHLITCGWLGLGSGNSGTDGSEFDQYVRALYWAFATLTTVGYGDITAQNNLQMLYSCFVGFIGVGFYGYMISNIASLLARQDAARERHMTQLENVENFLSFHEIPRELRKDIRDYYRFIWLNKKSFEHLVGIHELPSRIQSRLFYHINKKSLERIPFLKKASQELFEDLMAKLESKIVVPGEALFQQGDEGDSLYIIHSGQIAIKTDSGKTIAILSKGDFFGEHALLSNEARNASAFAHAFSDVFILSKDSFAEVLEKHPDFKIYIKSLDHRRLSEVG